MTNSQQKKQITEGAGFIAALDQSGGSTPKALKLYGIEPEEDVPATLDHMVGAVGG